MARLWSRNVDPHETGRKAAAYLLCENDQLRSSCLDGHFPVVHRLLTDVFQETNRGPSCRVWTEAFLEDVSLRVVLCCRRLYEETVGPFLPLSRPWRLDDRRAMRSAVQRGRLDCMPEHAALRVNRMDPKEGMRSTLPRPLSAERS